MPAPELNKYALIVAGGRGARMGCETPKQFLNLSSKPVLVWAIEAFYRYSEKVRIILVLQKGLEEKWMEMCRDHSLEIPFELVEGGEERYHSVKNGLEKVEEGALVAIHDGVRPLVSQRIISDSFNLAARFGSAVPVTPMNETIRQIKEGSSRIIDRTFLFSVQTPQTFLSALIKKAYQQEFRSEFTDDASLLEALNEKIHYFPGDTKNIKITRKEDLQVAGMLINS